MKDMLATEDDDSIRIAIQILATIVAWRLVSQTNDVMFFSTERTFCLSVALEALHVKGVRALQLEDCFARFMQRF